MMRCRHAIVGLAAWLCAPAQGQEVNANVANDMRANLQESQSVVGRAAPLDRAGAGLGGSALQFSTEQGETEASLAVKFDLDRYEPKSIGEGLYRMSALNLVLTATTPVGDQEKTFGLFSGDSLVTGTRLKIALTRTWTVQKDQSDVEPYRFQTRRACIEREVVEWVGSDTSRKPAADVYLDAVRALPFDNTSYDGTLRTRLTGYGAVASHVAQKCAGAGVRSQAQAYAPHLLTDIDKAGFANVPIKFLGLDGSFGRNNYKLLDRTLFEVKESAKNSWEVATYFGMIDPKLTWSLRARALYGQTYEAPDEVEVCRTVTGSTDQECIKGPDGAPVRERAGLASVEGRYVLTLLDKQKIAFAPQVTYNFEDDEVGVEVPIYLSPDSDGKLSGGIKLAYTSKEDDFGIGLFIGVPFSIFYQ